MIECESFAHHSERDALRRDCRRYTSMEAAGWRVLRFTWEQVMFQPEWVLACVQDLVAVTIARQKRTKKKEQRAFQA